MFYYQKEYLFWNLILDKDTNKRQAINQAFVCWWINSKSLLCLVLAKEAVEGIIINATS